MTPSALLLVLLSVQYISGQVYESCQSTYVIEKDTSYAGSIPQVGISDEAACRTKCDSEADCIGFDIDTQLNTCSFITDTAVNGTATSGTNHYIREQACPFKTTSERCFFEYLGENTINGAFGPLRGADRTISDCLGSCLDITQCRASLYTPNTKSCLLFLSQSDLTNSDLTTEVGTQAYKMTTCNKVPLDGTCSDSYTKLSGYGMSNGQFVPNNNTQMDCQATCTAQTDCIGFDFNVNAAACYLHIDSKEQPTSKPGVDNYRKTKECQASQKACSYEAFGFYIPSSTYTTADIPGILSLNECIAACNEDTNCAGLIFNTVFRDGCKQYTTTAAFTDLQNLVQTTDGRMGYKRISCGDATSSSPTPAPGSCTTEYRQFPNKKVIGASLNGATTLVNCKAACTAGRDCWGLDYNTGDNTCWLFGSSVDPYTTPIDSTVQTETHYEKYRQCGTCKYNVFATKKSVAGQQFKNAYNTADSCLSACSSDGTCQAVDYDTLTNKCYFLTAMPSATTIQTDVNFDQYRKDGACAGGAGCDFNNFKFYAGKKIPGGVLVATSPQTADTCKAKCISDPTCLAFDVDANFDCYLIKTDGEMVDGVPGENHFHREPQCNSNAYTGCQYFATGTFAPASVTSSQPNKSKQDCFDSCVDANTCSGLSYDRAARTCNLYGKTSQWTYSALVNSNNANLEAYKFNGCSGSTGTTNTGPGGCTNTWTNFPNTHAQGGVEQTGINTPAECKQKCIDSPDCVGVDIDEIRVPLCYLHLNSANLDNRGPLDGVTLYILQRCSGTGTTAATTAGSGGTTGRTTSTPAGGACTKSYKLYSGRKISGGLLVGGSVNSVPSCKTWCDQKPQCAGFDFNKNDNTCWWLQKTSPLEVATDGADHYAKNIKCGDCSYDVFPGKKVNMITGATSVQQSADDCLNACNAVSECQAVTYAKDKTCTFFTATYSSNLGPQVDTTYYEQSVCQCTATYQYKKATNSKVSGGILAGDAHTEAACKTNCNNNNKCIGFDFNGQNQCWITESGNNNPITPAGQENVNHYTKYAECGDCRYDIIGASKVTAVAGKLQANLNTWKDCIGACTTPACQSVDFNTKTNQCYHFAAKYDTGLGTDPDVLHFVQTCVKKCTAVYKYDVAKRSKVLGGLLAGGSTTLNSCKATCNTDQTCIGFDFTVKGECWTTPASNKNGVVSSGSEDVDHYTKFAECGDCRYDIIGASKVTAATGMLQSDISTWKDCISACTVATPSCQSVDFNTQTNTCYHFSATHDTGLGMDNSVLHFVQKCSSASTTSSMSVTQLSTTGSGAATTAPPGESCPLSYKTYVGKKIVGLTLAPNMATVDDCKSTCNGNSECVGFDYNTAASAALACWLQKDSGKSLVAQSPGEQVTHYEQKRTCGGCDFKPYINLVPTDSSLAAGISTEEACIASCSKSSTCKTSAFKGNQCYQSSGTTKIIETGTKTWEKVGTCGSPQTTCSPTYLKYSNNHVNGGTYIPNVTDGPSCQSACDSRDNCVGYDITTNGECWLTVSAAAQRNPVIAGSGVDHYAKVMKCNNVCYRQVMDSSYPTSTSYGEQTLNNCLLACNTQTASCRDVIYSPQATQGKCRFVMSASTISISSDLTTASGVTFYSRLSSCSDGATQATVAANTATTTRAPELSTTVTRTGANANAGDDSLAIETTQTNTDALPA